MKTFIFRSYSFDVQKATAVFSYAFDSGEEFEEVVTFVLGEEYDDNVLEKALSLVFLLIGVSYFKTFPTPNVAFETGEIDAWQADFLNTVYQEGLGQFAFENSLTRNDLAHFTATTDNSVAHSIEYSGNGVIALQSGGKDSLLTAALLTEQSTPFSSFYVSNSSSYPNILDSIGSKDLVIARREIDRTNLEVAKQNGGLNGHIPVTYIVEAIAVVQAILSGKSTIFTSIAHEGEEPHSYIDDLPVNHQWSKTWQAEQLFSEYVSRYISPSITIGSPLRSMSELKVAELFVQKVWPTYRTQFSSCNNANYKQNADNTTLSWCGVCPKCANSYLLFAPFAPADELKGLFDGKDLFADANLQEVFKGLLGIDGVEKPFECVGEIEELRLAYHQAQATGAYQPLSFFVPESHFDYNMTYPSALHLT